VGSSRIPQKGAATKGNAFGPHKYAGKSALRYELGVDILAGNLLWIQVPYPAGKYTNIKIFNKVLRNFLEPGKRVKADERYRSTAATPTKSCPGNNVNLAENWGIQGRVRARHKKLNGWLENWGILSQVFRHHIMMHGDVFRACTVVTQPTATARWAAARRDTTTTMMATGNNINNVDGDGATGNERGGGLGQQ